MTDRLPGYYRATVVPEQLRFRQCALCRTPVDEGYHFCFRCNGQTSAHPDLAGFVAYAVRGSQPGAEMYRYKNQPPSRQALGNVLLLLGRGLSHMGCAGHLVGQPVGAVAVVPSRSHYQAGAPSMLQRLCVRELSDGMPLVDIRSAPGSTSDRRVHRDAFDVITPPEASHVMLIDDTWVSAPPPCQPPRCERPALTTSPCSCSPAGSTPPTDPRGSSSPSCNNTHGTTPRTCAHSRLMESVLGRPETVDSQETWRVIHGGVGGV